MPAPASRRSGSTASTRSSSSGGCCRRHPAVRLAPWTATPRRCTSRKHRRRCLRPLRCRSSHSAARSAPGRCWGCSGRRGTAPWGSLLPHADADDSVQRALARTAGHRTREPEAAPAPFRSPALLLRSQLRVARAVTTTGGEWDTDRYDLKRDDNGQGPAPAAQNWRGVDITLKFKPSGLVDAELIGLTQSVQSHVGGKPNLTAGAAARPISAATPNRRESGRRPTRARRSTSRRATRTRSMPWRTRTAPRCRTRERVLRRERLALQGRRGDAAGAERFAEGHAAAGGREQGLAPDLRGQRAGDEGRTGRHLLRLRALGLAHRRRGRVHQGAARGGLTGRAVRDLPQGRAGLEREQDAGRQQGHGRSPDPRREAHQRARDTRRGTAARRDPAPAGRAS